MSRSRCTRRYSVVLLLASLPAQAQSTAETSPAAARKTVVPHQDGLPCDGEAAAVVPAWSAPEPLDSSFGAKGGVSVSQGIIGGAAAAWFNQTNGTVHGARLNGTTWTSSPVFQDVTGMAQFSRTETFMDAYGNRHVVFDADLFGQKTVNAAWFSSISQSWLPATTIATGTQSMQWSTSGAHLGHNIVFTWTGLTSLNMGGFVAGGPVYSTSPVAMPLGLRNVPRHLTQAPLYNGGPLPLAFADNGTSVLGIQPPGAPWFYPLPTTPGLQNSPCTGNTALIHSATSLGLDSIAIVHVCYGSGPERGIHAQFLGQSFLQLDAQTVPLDDTDIAMAIDLANRTYLIYRDPTTTRIYVARHQLPGGWVGPSDTGVNADDVSFFIGLNGDAYAATWSTLGLLQAVVITSDGNVWVDRIDDGVQEAAVSADAFGGATLVYKKGNAIMAVRRTM